MNKVLKDMLVGVILGDAHIKKLGSNKAFISFGQSKNKSEYVKYLHNIIKEGGLPMIEFPIKEYSTFDPRFNKTNFSLHFKTQSNEMLRPLADTFLDENGRKIIPTNIAEYLTHRSLAFWIMDDGQQVKRGGVTLCTDSFNHNEVSILREALKTNFDIDTNVHLKKGKNDALYERIYIPKAGLEELKPNIVPHIHDSMLYKINAEADFKQNTEGFESNQESETEIDIIDT
jgi:LAGLIDADG DNA endonuclease family